MKICDAVCNEHGEGRGGAAGDQTGKELRHRDWYERSGGWGCCLVPKDKEKAKKSASIAIEIVESRRCGYDKDRRWTLYKQLKAHDWRVNDISPCDCDCSSLVITCLIGAGYDLLPTGYTGNLERLLLKTGEFVKRDGSEESGRLGAVYLTANAHTAIVTDYDGPDDEDDPKNLVKVLGRSVRIRKIPKTGSTVKIAHKGDLFDIISIDEESGWYLTEYGYITNNSQWTERI